MENNGLSGVLIFLGALAAILIPLLIWSARVGEKRKAAEATKRSEAMRIRTEEIEKRIRELAAADKILPHHASQLFDEIKASIHRADVLINAAISIKEKYDSLALKYGNDIAAKIINGEYFIGMTEEMLIDSKGEPTKRETEQMKTKTKNTLVYGNKSSGDIFYFENGVLTKFKDR